MDQEKNSLFFKYLRMFFDGFCVGICFGILMLLTTVNIYTFVLALLALLSTVMLWKCTVKYDFHLVFGLAMGLGIGLMGGLYFLKTTSFHDAFVAFSMIFAFFSINYAILKLIRHTIREIINRNTKKTK